MIIRQVTTIEQAQIVREIRNSVREHMTRHTEEITEYQQEQWFATQSGLLYLYFDNTTVIGYSYLRDIDDRSWGTLAVVPDQQGKGYGMQIYKHLISLTNRLWIEIYSDNISSMRAAINAGFNIEHVGDKVIVFSAKRSKT